MRQSDEQQVLIMLTLSAIMLVALYAPLY